MLAIPSVNIPNSVSAWRETTDAAVKPIAIPELNLPTELTDPAKN